MRKHVITCDGCGCDCAEHQTHPMVITVSVGALVQGRRRKDLAAVPFPAALRTIAAEGNGTADFCVKCACALVGDGTVEPPTPEAIFQAVSDRLLRSPGFHAPGVNRFEIDVTGLEVGVSYRLHDGTEGRIGATLTLDEENYQADYEGLEADLVAEMRQAHL